MQTQQADEGHARTVPAITQKVLDCTVNTEASSRINCYHRHHQSDCHLQPAISLAICMMGKPASASVMQNADVTRGLLESQGFPFDCFSLSKLSRLEGRPRHRVRCATEADESSAAIDGQPNWPLVWGCACCGRLECDKCVDDVTSRLMKT